MPKYKPSRIIALSLLVSCLIATDANADSFTLTDSSGLKFFVNHNIAFTTTSSASGAMSEASYAAAVAASTANGGMTMSSLNDAFDGYGTLVITTDAMAATVAPSTGNAAHVFYNKNGAAALGCGDREVTFVTQAVGSLNVTRRIFIPSNDTFARRLEVIENTGTMPVTVFVGYANNLGSDSNTIITGSSTSDMAVTTDDRWVTSMQNYSGMKSSDPRLGHVFYGAGTVTSPVMNVNFVNGDDNPYWWYQVQVPAGAKRSILTYVTGQPSKAAAATQAAALADLTNPHALDCLSLADRSNIVNFKTVCKLPGDEGMACDDGLLCTINGVCTAGVCVSTPKACRSNAADCTGVCNPSTGDCDETNVDNGTTCNDGNLCNGADTCMAGACTPGATPLACDDSNACTSDSCVPASGCAHAAITTGACAPPAPPAPPMSTAHDAATSSIAPTSSDASKGLAAADAGTDGSTSDAADTTKSSDDGGCGITSNDDLPWTGFGAALVLLTIAQTRKRRRQTKQ